MDRHTLIEYYSNEKIAGEILRNSRGREIAGALWDGRYDQRPNILQYVSDIVQMARKGVTSFHYSVEHWSNPMALSSDNYASLRRGWDMIIDIDSKLGLEESKLTAEMIVRLLGKYGITPGVKFSGRRGFHICIPWSLFPREIDYKPLEKMYPEIPRIIAAFIRERIKDELLRELVKSRGAGALIESMGATSELDPFYFVEVEKDWGNRHMFRAPFSMNEKTWLVSVPIEPNAVAGFDPKDAEHEKVLSKSHPDFFHAEGDATTLLTEAMDWHALRKKEPVEKKQITRWEQKVPEELFPPCIKSILAGLDDGKKRSIFTLVNFLRMMNWTPEEIEQKIAEWNTRNRPPLPNAIVASTVRYHERRTLTPANCFNDQFYVAFGVCKPDEICKRMKAKKTSNPIVYPFMKMGPKKRPKVRGFSCGVCNKELPTMRSLAMHKGKSH